MSQVENERSLADLREERDRLDIERQRLFDELVRAEQHKTDTKTGFEHGRRMPADRYKIIASRYAEAVTHKQSVERALGTVKRKLHALNAELYRRENGLVQSRTYRPSLTEFDLKNALAEPTQLLQMIYVAFKKKTANLGISEAERAILDSTRDYLIRQGIMLP
jgi:hypothetical protein